MVVELIGQQLRVRIVRPGLCIPDSFRTQDLGIIGRLQRIACKSKRTKKFITQAFRMSLADYESREDAISELRSIRGLSRSQVSRGTGLIKKWFGR